MYFFFNFLENVFFFKKQISFAPVFQRHSGKKVERPAIQRAGFCYIFSPFLTPLIYIKVGKELNAMGWNCASKKDIIKSKAQNL